MIENINIEDKSFLHKNHSSNQKGKFHLKISIKSTELKKISKINSNRKIYKILEKELEHLYPFYTNTNYLILFLKMILNIFRYIFYQ